MAGFVAERSEREVAKSGLKGPLRDLFDQRFGLAAVFDQIGNGANQEAMFGGKQL